MRWWECYWICIAGRINSPCLSTAPYEVADFELINNLLQWIFSFYLFPKFLWFNLLNLCMWVLFPRHVASSGSGWGYGLQIWRVAANILNMQSWTADRDGPPAWGFVEGLTTPHRKKETVTHPLGKPRNWTDFLVRPQQMNKGMRFGAWNVTSLYRTGAVTVARELAKHRLDLVGGPTGS